MVSALQARFGKEIEIYTLITQGSYVQTFVGKHLKGHSSVFHLVSLQGTSPAFHICYRTHISLLLQTADIFHQILLYTHMKQHPLL